MDKLRDHTNNQYNYKTPPDITSSTAVLESAFKIESYAKALNAKLKSDLSEEGNTEIISDLLIKNIISEALKIIKVTFRQ